MVQGVSARENCPKDILITLLNGPKSFEQIVSELSPKYSRGTINKYLNELYEMGEITRNGRRGPYILTPKGREQAERENQRRKILKETENLSSQEIQKLLLRFEYYKLGERIRDFNVEFLPELAVTQKLESLGFKPSDYKLYNVCAGGFYDDYTSDDILLFEVPCEQETLNLKKYQKKEVYFKVNGVFFPAKLVAYVKSKRIMFFGMYKRLPELCKQREKIEADLIKMEFNLSENDIKNANPKVLEKLKNSESTYWMYVASKKPNAFDLFMKHFMGKGFNEKMAKRIVENTLRFFKALEKEVENNRPMSPQNCT